MSSSRRQVRAAPRQTAPAQHDAWATSGLTAVPTALRQPDSLPSSREHSDAQSRASHLVNTLHRDIIPRLVSAHAPVAPIRSAPPPALDVPGFVVLVLARDDLAIEALLADLQACGHSHQTLLTDLLAPCARQLGTMWNDDHCHFVDVTIALGRLQQIMRHMGSAPHTPCGDSARRVLLMPAPGEQHTFGLAMVSDFFARAGWDVAGVSEPDVVDVSRRVKYEWFDLIGVSAGSDARIDEIRRCLATVRTHSCNPSVLLMVGGPLFIDRPDLVRQVGADAAVTDGQHAPALADQLLRQRSTASVRVA